MHGADWMPSLLRFDIRIGPLLLCSPPRLLIQLIVKQINLLNPMLLDNIFEQIVAPLSECMCGRLDACSHVVGSKDGWKSLIPKDEPAYELGDGMDVWEMISSASPLAMSTIPRAHACAPFIWPNLHPFHVRVRKSASHFD